LQITLKMLNNHQFWRCVRLGGRFSVLEYKGSSPELSGCDSSFWETAEWKWPISTLFSDFFQGKTFQWDDHSDYWMICWEMAVPSGCSKGNISVIRPDLVMEMCMILESANISFLSVEALNGLLLNK
jgi:hypothetical protein